MAYRVVNTDIYLTRGDTFKCQLGLTLSDGHAYVPSEGDIFEFAMKRNYSDTTVTLTKRISNNSLMLILDSSDTKDLPFGRYVYQIRLTKSNGDVDTFVKGYLHLTEEVA